MQCRLLTRTYVMAVTKGCPSHDLEEVFPNPAVVQPVWERLEVVEHRVVNKFKHQVPPLLLLVHFQQAHKVLMSELLLEKRKYIASCLSFCLNTTCFSNPTINIGLIKDIFS